MNKNILLIEPAYRNKFPPLGLMKIAAYHRQRGDRVVFAKGRDDFSASALDAAIPAHLWFAEDEAALDQVPWERVYITTLFSFEYETIARTIDQALKLVHGNSQRVFVGGIAATLMHDRFMRDIRWRGVRFIKGMLDQAPALSLQLDDFAEEYGSDDLSGTPIEALIPDYSILDQVAYDYPVADAYFMYASRGCVRKCAFCAVPKLEGDMKPGAPIIETIQSIDRLYGPKRDLTLMDNNVVAAPNWREIIAEIRGAGFAKGATVQRGRSVVSRRVDFNQGVDARFLAKDIAYLREMATIALSPLRIAFDHVGMRKPYEKAIRMAHEVGLHDLSNYLLYNFEDTPEDLYERMRINIALNEELGIRIFSFPMRYHPVDRPDRGHVGKHWTRYELRSMQVMLQASHGIVSGSPDFFRFAYGDTVQTFRKLLRLPEKMLFHRTWFQSGGGQSERMSFEHEASSLSDSDWKVLLDLLSQARPGGYATLASLTTNSAVRRLLPYYAPLSRRDDAALSAARNMQALMHPVGVVINDAGLEANSAESLMAA